MQAYRTSFSRTDRAQYMYMNEEPLRTSTDTQLVLLCLWYRFLIVSGKRISSPIHIVTAQQAL